MSINQVGNNYNDYTRQLRIDEMKKAEERRQEIIEKQQKADEKRQKEIKEQARKQTNNLDVYA